MIADILLYTSRNHTPVNPEYMARVTWGVGAAQETLVLGPGTEEEIGEAITIYITIERVKL